LPFSAAIAAQKTEKSLLFPETCIRSFCVEIREINARGKKAMKSFSNFAAAMAVVLIAFFSVTTKAQPSIPLEAMNRDAAIAPIVLTLSFLGVIATSMRQSKPE
jgi:hypothetical protein